MPRTRPRRPPVRTAAHERAELEDRAAIDARYGLEPVFEPSAADRGADRDADRGGTRFETVQCPYCGEMFETLLDLSAGSADYIEDCQVCCQPIEFRIEIDAEGRLAHTSVRRGG